MCVFISLPLLGLLTYIFTRKIKDNIKFSLFASSFASSSYSLFFLCYPFGFFFGCFGGSSCDLLLVFTVVIRLIIWIRLLQDASLPFFKIFNFINFPNVLLFCNYLLVSLHVLVQGSVKFESSVEIDSFASRGRLQLTLVPNTR